MKKIILLSILNLFLSQVFSQSLELYSRDTLLVTDEVRTITAHADSGAMSFEELDVLNTGINPLLIFCTREVISEVENTTNLFCWGVCYSTTTDTSTVSIKINPGEFSNEFVGDYFPQGYTGTTSVRYTFFDVANPNDQISFIVNYKASTESSIHDKLAKVYLSPAYPNPANNEVSINYEMERNELEVKIVIFNLLGTSVKEARISNFSGSLKINTSDLTEGIYFYSLLINDEPTQTHKLIIKH